MSKQKTTTVDKKKVSMLQKISYMFDKKQKRQMAGLAVLIPVSYTHLTLPTKA